MAPGDLVVIVLTGVVAATVAAFVPSRTVTRIPVLSALAGRVPLGRVPRAVVPAGLLLGVAGTALVALGAIVGRDSTSSANLSAAVVVLGGVAVLAAVCCLSPAIVAVFGVAGERVAGTTRLAARSLARTRTRSAAVVSAIAAAGALSVGIATLAAASWTDAAPPFRNDLHLALLGTYDFDPPPPGPPTVVDGVAYGENPPPPVFSPPPADAAARLQAIVPGTTMLTVRSAGYDPGPEPLTGSPPIENTLLTSIFTVADPDLLDALAVSDADRHALDTVGVLAFPPYLPDRDPVPGDASAVQHVVANTETGPLAFDVAATTRPEWNTVVGLPLITPARAEELGFTIGDSGLLLVAPHDLAGEPRTRLSDAFGYSNGPFDTVTRSTGVYVSMAWPPEDPPRRALIDTTVVVAAALAFTAAIVAATKAVLLALVGGLLAVPAGFVPIAAVVAERRGESAHVVFPWAVAFGCVAVVPLLVGAGALAASAVTQRLRPVRMSTLATD
ncbi:MAG: hypothetical protein QM733_00150 [Ilumatobacteraceae bacterium]